MKQNDQQNSTNASSFRFDHDIGYFSRVKKCAFFNSLLGTMLSILPPQFVGLTPISAVASTIFPRHDTEPAIPDSPDATFPASLLVAKTYPRSCVRGKAVPEHAGILSTGCPRKNRRNDEVVKHLVGFKIMYRERSF